MAKKAKEIKQSKANLPDSVQELLADNEISGMIQSFIDKDMANCAALVIIQKSKDGRVTCHTNLADLTLFGLVSLVIKNWDDADETP